MSLKLNVSVWLQQRWHICALIGSFTSCLPTLLSHTQKCVSNRCHKYCCMTLPERNTYYIEIYMTIDIDGYDLYYFCWSLITQEICVRTVSEPFFFFAYWHLCTDLQWTVMTLLNLGICKCSIVWCPEALVFILFILVYENKEKKDKKKNQFFCVWLWHTDQTSTVYCSLIMYDDSIPTLSLLWQRNTKKITGKHPDVKYDMCIVCL